MTARWLENLYQHDMISLMMFGFAMLGVLAGWAATDMTKSKFDRFLKITYLVYVLLFWVGLLAGSAVLTITAGG